jgi:hypothetical protein
VVEAFATISRNRSQAAGRETPNAVCDLRPCDARLPPMIGGLMVRATITLAFSEAISVVGKDAKRRVAGHETGVA